MIWALIASATLTLISAAVASFSSAERRSITALWFASIGVGGIYLSLGAEMLAIVQWIVATLSAVAFHFFASLFGEERESRPRSQLLVPVLGGASLLAILLIGALSGGPESISAFSLGPIAESVANPPSGQRAVDLGYRLIGDHLVSLEILGLCLFISILGAGVISRPDAVETPEGGPS